jgi:uncharacterized Zn-binding protein involved in type VI secretion
MNTKIIYLALACLVPPPLAAQSTDVITMDQEPHHHLVLHNDDVKVFNVVVSPGDSIVLHRHDQDTIAIAIGDQLVTVGVPGKPDVHQKNADAQVRLQRGGYMHSTRVDGDTPYHTVAVELLRPQTNFHNLCAEILPGQPLNCTEEPLWRGEPNSVVYISKPELKSDQTYVRLVIAGPPNSINIANDPVMRDVARLIVALDSVVITSGSSAKQEERLQAGEFKWFGPGQGAVAEVRSAGEQEARLIEIIFPVDPK